MGGENSPLWSIQRARTKHACVHNFSMVKVNKDILSNNKDVVVILTKQESVSKYVYMCLLQEKTTSIIKDEFPFTKYFANAPQPIFKGRSYTEDMDMAEGCFRHIKKIFTQLEVKKIKIKMGIQSL